MAVELTETLLRDNAGWDVLKQARAQLAQGQVLSSYWEPPLCSYRRAVVAVAPQTK